METVYRRIFVFSVILSQCSPLAETVGCPSGELFEYPGKIVDTGKAQGFSDFRHSHVRVPQKPFGFPDFHGQKIVDHTAVRLAFKHPLEGAGRAAGAPANMGN